MEEKSSRSHIVVRNVHIKAVEAVRSRYGLFGLAFISYLESTLVIPLITDPFLVGYILAHQGRVIRGVVATTLSSVLGGLTAYIFAVGFFELSLGFLSEESVATMYELSSRFEEGAFVLTLLGAVTPVPYTLVALAAGFVQSNLLLFLLATIIGRGFRYALVGYLTYKFGDQSLKIIKRNLKAVTIVLFVVAGLYLLAHYS